MWRRGMEIRIYIKGSRLLPRFHYVAAMHKPASQSKDSNGNLKVSLTPGAERSCSIPALCRLLRGAELG